MKKKKYKATKIPTVKLCLDCHREIGKYMLRCRHCEERYEKMQKSVSKLDEEYRLAYSKHKLRG